MTRPVGLAALCLLACACTSTSRVAPAALESLHTPSSDQAVILEDVKRGKVRVDPNSAMRFWLTDGRVTPWIPVRKLRTGDEGLFVTHRVPAEELDGFDGFDGFDGDGEMVELESGILWSQITQAEVRNFSGSKSLALVVGGAAVITLVAALSKGSGGRSLALGTAEVTLRGVQLATIASLPHRPIYRGTVRDSEQDNLQEQTSGTTRLFAGVSRRRSVIRLVPSVQSMATLGAPEGLEQSAAFSLRLGEVWEFGGGARAAYLAAPKQDARMRFIGFGRAGLHFNLDQDHRFAVPLLIDVGGGASGLVQARLNIGLRIRATETFSVGIWAPSPTLTRVRGGAKDEVFHRWSFPAGVELSFAL